MVETLARELSEGLHTCLSEAQMQVDVEHNRAETAPGECHSRDADMVLYEVFLRHGMDPAAEGVMDLYRALWDQA